MECKRCVCFQGVINTWHIYISITSTHLPLSFDWFLEIVKAERLERQNSWCEKRQEIVRQHVVEGECLFVSQYQQTPSNAVIWNIGIKKYNTNEWVWFYYTSEVLQHIWQRRNYLYRILRFKCKHILLCQVTTHFNRNTLFRENWHLIINLYKINRSC